MQARRQGAILCRIVCIDVKNIVLGSILVVGSVCARLATVTLLLHPSVHDSTSLRTLIANDAQIIR